MGCCRSISGLHKPPLGVPESLRGRARGVLAWMQLHCPRNGSRFLVIVGGAPVYRQQIFRTCWKGALFGRSRPWRGSNTASTKPAFGESVSREVARVGHDRAKATVQLDGPAVAEQVLPRRRHSDARLQRITASWTALIQRGGKRGAPARRLPPDQSPCLITTKRPHGNPKTPQNVHIAVIRCG